MVQNWAELKYGKRLKKLAKEARDRVRAKHPEKEGEIRSKERKDWVWHTLTEATYSKLAFTVGMFLALCIALSTIAFILETVPAYERDAKWSNYFFYAEVFFVIVFSIEIVLKFWSTPQTTLEFFKDVLNVIDILSILPFYIELIMITFAGGKVALVDLRGLRAFRLMRMLKMGRFSTDIQLLAEGFVRARVSIALLCGTLILGTIIFSVLMWITERGTWSAAKQCYARSPEVFYNDCSPFQSVPFGFWWAMTTMTTVGYGDAFPTTPMGRVIGGIAMVAGIFCVALPTGILCAEFSKLYEERRSRRADTAITHEISMRPKVELELFLDSEKLAQSRNDWEEQLLYMKRLAYIYHEMQMKKKIKHGEDGDEKLKLDPMFTTFVGHLTESLDSMRNVVNEVSDDLAKVKKTIGAIAGNSRRRMTRSFSQQGQSARSQSSISNV